MALVFLEEFENGSELGLWKIEELATELEKKLQLNKEERKFYQSLNKGQRTLQWLASRVLVRHMLQTEKFIVLNADENGKPLLGNFRFELSISHSYDYAAVILGHHRVGVDIEKIKPKIQFIAPRFTTEKEREFIPETHKDEMLYVIWCAKESLFKLYGAGELNFRNHIHIHPFGYHQNQSTLTATIHKNSFRKDYTVFYRNIDHYMMAWVTEVED